jgi:hypothetical protein
MSVQSLRATLSSPTVDVISAATAARALFAGTDPARTRWLDLELGGYGALAQAPVLHDLLGVPADHPLAQVVAGYRSQVGRSWSRDARSDTVVHFFVEPLAQLVEARDRLGAAGATGLVELAFTAKGGAPAYPRADFPADVFERILLGVVAALWHELGVLAP